MTGPLRVRDLMTSEVTTLHRNDKLSLADDLMTMKRVRHLPVLEDESDELVGILSQRDLFRGALARALGYGEKAQRRMLDTLVVKEVMTNQVVTTDPDTALADAARTMLERKIGCLPVLEKGRLIGILTESDFLALATRAS
jgi:CBS domain-containing protein